MCRVTFLRLGLFTFILETFAALERDENLLLVHDWVLSWVRKGCGEMVSVISDGEKCFHCHAVGEISGEIVWMEDILIHVSISTMNFPFVTASYGNCNSASIESFSLLLLSSARIKFPLSWIIRREKFVGRSATKVRLHYKFSSELQRTFWRKASGMRLGNWMGWARLKVFNCTSGKQCAANNSRGRVFIIQNCSENRFDKAIQ